MSGLVLVTGATGKTGRSLVSLLAESGVAYRTASRGGAPRFDWSQAKTWDAALEGVASVYLVVPPAVDDAPSRMAAFLESAMRKGVHRFVLLSMASLPAGGPGSGQVHQWLKDNSEDWAVLCPSAFMQNFSEGLNLASIRDEDTIYSNTGTGRVPFISTVDIARAAFAALTAPAALNSELTLTGVESISYDRVAELISQACGRPILHTQISTAAMAERFVSRGLPEGTATFLAAAYQTIAGGWQDRTAEGFRTLTGGSPMTFQAFAAANADVWKRAQAAV
ncbi:NmrA family NAD(P)-binding protein [Phenylobacterium sp.]|uniref:NmrA family NAD(P)-binding protein n=1 Tax=Phenylobacterium sp. TaxID=1871053 RepID=UPI0011FCF339|nr:NmrA family NAD(P)-binding protein [Phenylobacterium sp.]THD53514.1 MAG: ergot alkaloid biosynthesis protein [Phenylobacterium sp.]